MARSALGFGCALHAADGAHHQWERQRDARQGAADEHADTERLEQLRVQVLGHHQVGLCLLYLLHPVLDDIGVQGRRVRQVAGEVQHGAENPIASVAADNEEDAALARQKAHTNGEQRHVEHAIHVIRHAQPIANGGVLEAVDLVHDQVHRGADAASEEHQLGLLHARARRLEHRRDRDAAGIGQPLVVDHVLAQRDNEAHAEDRTDDAADDHGVGVEGVGVAQDEQGWHREHHSGRGAVDGAGDGLVDVVLDDALTAAGCRAVHQSPGWLRAPNPRSRSRG